MFTHLLKDMLKDTFWTGRWRGTEDEVWEGSEHRSFSPPGVRMGHLPGVDVCTHMEALQAPTSGIFVGGFPA